jgi:putative ABC transport system ATP-binding protein
MYLRFGGGSMITVGNLSKKFRDGTLLEYKDMTYETGRTYALLGASGCGKTTLLNMIAGILSPYSGTIEIDGRAISSASQHEKDRFRIERIGYIFQDFKLIDQMSVEDNIRVLELEHVDIADMDGILDRLGILKFKRRKVNRLSGGEKQRVAIARALIKKPDIILADEPTGNLNFLTGLDVVRALIEVARGKTLIAVTHDDRLAELFDEVLDMAGLVAYREVIERA